MDHEAARVSLERLSLFLGTWDLEAIFPSKPGEVLRAGRSVFEWMKEQRLLIQRTEVPLPNVPDSVSIVTYDAGKGGYLQHYFDSRGVARLYRMSLEDGIWTLLRDAPDFSPLDFLQRYRGVFDTDGSAIRGAWEKSTDGVHWEKDFDLSYLRAG